MSNTELNNQPDYNDLDKNIDKNLNNFENDVQNTENIKINDNLIQFFKEVSILFVTIFVWGFLGSVGIFWLKRAAYESIGKDYSIDCYRQDDTDSFNFTNYLDVYFPYNSDKLPYFLKSNSSCDPRKATHGLLINNSLPCGSNRQRAFVEKYTDKAKTNIKSLDFPYNLLDTDDNYKQLENLQTDTFYKKMVPLTKIIYKDGLKNPFICSRKILNKIFTYTSDESKWWLNEQFLMIFMKLVFAIIIFIKFFSGLIMSIFEVFKTFFDNKDFKIPGIWFCAWAAEYVFKNNSGNWMDRNITIKDNKDNFFKSLVDALRIIVKIIVFIIIFLPTFIIDISIIALFTILFLIVFAPLFGFIFIVSLLSIIVQLFSLFEGAIRSGKLTEIFKCNINLLIFLFGALVFMSAKHNLDPYMFKFIGISWALYVCYTLFKLFIS